MNVTSSTACLQRESLYVYVFIPHSILCTSCVLSVFIVHMSFTYTVCEGVMFSICTMYGCLVHINLMQKCLAHIHTHTCENVQLKRNLSWL